MNVKSYNSCIHSLKLIVIITNNAVRLDDVLPEDETKRIDEIVEAVNYVQYNVIIIY